MTSADLLTFERAWLNRAQHDGRKDQAISETFGFTSIRYYQMLVEAIRTPDALELDPVTVGVITRRMRASQRQRYPWGTGQPDSVR